MHNLAGIALIVMLGALGLAYLVDQASEKTAPPLPSLADVNDITQTVGGRELSIPKTWFRFGEQMQDGFVGQVDLSVQLPLGPESRQARVDITLLPRSRAKASSELLDTVYVHQFASETLTGMPGLVGKRLDSDQRLFEETIWYDALAASPFVAKCMAPLDGNAPDRCIRTVQLPTGLSAIFSFEADILPNWKAFDPEASRWLQRIGAL